MPRDLAYLTVNQNYSSLLFDCGLAAGREGWGVGRLASGGVVAYNEEAKKRGSSGTFLTGEGGPGFVSDMEPTLKI